MTIQPAPPALVESAPVRLPLDTESTGRRPLPDGWCYRCGFSRCSSVPCEPRDSKPIKLDHAVLRAGVHATDELGSPPEGLTQWQPGHIETVRALAHLLNAWAEQAERAAERRPA